MNESVEINGKVYNVGDKINFKYHYHKASGEDLTGVIKFGIYEDDEGYSTNQHIGFYVEWEYINWENRVDTTYKTLIDIINGTV
jgi:hypothetical protein